MNNEIYKCIAFPDELKIKEIHSAYFDTEKLFFDLNNLKIQQQIPVDFELKDINYLLNNGLHENLRRINNQIFRLDLAMLKMINYKYLLYTTVNENKRCNYLLLFRMESYNVASEIFNLLEKYKTIIKMLYNIDIKEKSNSKLAKIINNLSQSDSNLKNFSDKFKAFCTSDDYKLVYAIRTDETHNLPILDKISMTKTNGDEFYITLPTHEIESEAIFKKIKICLNEIVLIKKSLEVCIENKTMMLMPK